MNLQPTLLRSQALWRLGGVIAAALLLAACHLTPANVLHIRDAPERENITVNTEYGPVTGMQSRSGRAFLGIPYAAAPTGQWRWSLPRPPQSWVRPHDATRLGKPCVQNYSFLASEGSQSSWLVKGSEDCLNVNVYTPANLNPKEKVPVMMWLYGGGLMLGENRQYDFSRLAQEGRVVVVVPNYRLGALSFFTSPALRKETGGVANLALADQQAALRWVKRNIGAFGGDAARVTLFGESAGAWSVCHQLASPGAAGLFSRAIMQSGACTLNTATVPLKAADASSQEAAKTLGCPAGPQQLACLRALPARKVMGIAPFNPNPLGRFGWTFIYGDALLPERPVQVFRSGRSHAVPVLEGINRDEGNFFAHLIGRLNRLNTRADFVRHVKYHFGAEQTETLAALYPEADFPKPQQALAQLISDNIFVCSSERFETGYAAHAPLWVYRFDDPTPPAGLIGLRGVQGAYHTSEIIYITRTPWALANPKYFTPAQEALSKRMQAVWVRFAYTGHPGWAAFTPADPVAHHFAPEADSLQRVAHKAVCETWWRSY